MGCRLRLFLLAFPEWFCLKMCQTSSLAYFCLNRSKEAATDRIRSVLDEKVAKEERRLARAKQVYAALRHAWLVNKEDPLGRGAAGGFRGCTAFII